jgi:hypothetical protein
MPSLAVQPPHRPATRLRRMDATLHTSRRRPAKARSAGCRALP